ncbi:hypothetical protein P168DRAFT_217982, partial [Aspergillus campestris IBT 28561]
SPAPPRHRPATPRDPRDPRDPRRPPGSSSPAPAPTGECPGRPPTAPGQPLPTATSPPRPGCLGADGAAAGPEGYIFPGPPDTTHPNPFPRHHGNVPGAPQALPRRLLPPSWSGSPKPEPRYPPTGQSWSPDPEPRQLASPGAPSPEPLHGPAPSSPANWQVLEPRPPVAPSPANWPVPPPAWEPSRVPADAQLPSPTRGPMDPRQLASTRPRQLARPSDWSPLPQFHLGPPSQVPPLDSSTDHQGSTEPRQLASTAAPSPSPGRRRSLAPGPDPRGGPSPPA